MGKLVVVSNVTLDGVTQGLGRSDEDTREGFEHGGWGVPYGDEVMGREMTKSMGSTRALLFGRRTYQDFFSVWPQQKDNPYSEVLNNTQKYVASTTLSEPLPWQNSSLLEGELTEAVAELKARLDGDLAVLGSGNLVSSLARAGLVDEYLLLIHPLVLAQGRRLFEDGTYAALQLVDTAVTTTGVIIATYRTT
ncbi:MAG: dihydrofolate reductase family protein [Nocardioidaceae bacterium]